MLHVDLFGLIARKCQIELEFFVLDELLPILLVEEVGLSVSLSEEEPVFALSSSCYPLLEECAEGCHPCTWTYHDDGNSRVYRKSKAMGRLDVNRDRCGVDIGDMAEEMAGYSKTLLPGMGEGEESNCEIDLVREGELRGGDRVEAGE